MSISTSFEEDPFISNSDEFVPTVDKNLISSLVLPVKSKDYPPPELSDFAKQDSNLLIMAKNLHQIFSTPSFVTFSAEDLQNLELIIRSFISDIVLQSTIRPEEIQGEENEPAQYSTIENQKLQEELSQCQNDLQLLKTNLKAAEKSRDGFKSDNTLLQEEVKKLYEDNAITTKKFDAFRRETEKLTTELKSQKDQADDQLRIALDKIKILQYADERNQSQFKELTAAATSANSDILKLQDKLDVKKEKIEELESQIHELTIQNQGLEDENQKLAVYLNSTKTQLNESKNALSKFNSSQFLSIQHENETLQKAISTITNQYEAQSQEIINLRKSLMSTTELLQRQLETMAQYDRVCGTIATSSKVHYELTNQINQLKSQLLQKGERLEEVEQLMKSIMGLIGVDNQKDIIVRILKIKEYGCLENQLLITSFEDQIRFMCNLVNSDVVYGRANQPLNEDTTFAEKLKIEMVRLKKFIDDNTVQSENIPDEVKEEFNLDRRNRNDFALLAVQVKRNEILREYTARLKKDSDILLEIAQNEGYDVNDYIDLSVLPNELTKKQKEVQDFLNQASDILKTDINSENPYQNILDSIELQNQVLDEIKEVIKFDGNMVEIPHQVEVLTRHQMKTASIIDDNESIDKMNNSSNFKNFISKTRGMTSTMQSEIEFREQLSTMKSQFDTERDRFNETISQQRKKLAETTKRLKKVSAEKTKLDEQVKELATKNSEYAKQEETMSHVVSTMKSNHKEMEDQLTDLKEKNDRLQEDIDRRMKSADDRIEKLLNEEREQHQDELNNIQTRFMAMIERQKDETEKKNKRVKALKAKLKEVITSYEDAFKQQKETIRILREKTEQCATHTDLLTATKDVSHWESQIQMLESENKELKTQIDQLNNQIGKAQSARDSFWKAQLSMVENNTKSEVDQKLKSALQRISSQLNCDPTVDAIVGAIENKPKHRDFTLALANSIENQGSRQAMKQLDEWEKWSRQLYSNINHGEVFSHNSKELRFALGEMVLSSISQRLLTARLESLRTQKLIFTLGKTCDQTSQNQPPDIRSLMLLVSFLGRLRKMAGHLTPNLFQTSTLM